MPHQRLRKFRTKEWYAGTQDIDNDLCMAVVVGRHVFLRGQTGHDFEGTFHGLDDPATQAEQAMRNVKVLLAEAGSRLEDICKVTVYVTDRAYLEPVCTVIGRHLKGVYPVWTELIVDGLARPKLQMEVDVQAVRSTAEQETASVAAQ